MQRVHVASCVIGMVIGVGGTLLVAADAAPPQPGQRYQITSFAAAPGQGGAQHGAYVLDTVTGQVRWIDSLGVVRPADMHWDQK